MTALKTFGIAAFAYAAMIAAVRLSGKRTVSKWNAFDSIVTIALGSTLSTTILSSTTSLAQGTSGFITLIALQFVITFFCVRLSVIDRIIKAQPTVLLHDGIFDREQMKRQRVTESEVLAAIRNSGQGDVRRVAAVVLETDGSFSVVSTIPADAGDSSLRDLTRR